MILVEVKCGLGNQLFQYAAARELGHRLKVPVRADLRWYSGANGHRNRRDRRDYLLPELGLNLQPASPQELADLTPSWKFWRSPRALVLRQGDPEESLSAFNAARGPIRLEGYWQSERFFPESKASIAEALLKIPPDPRDSELVRILKQPSSIAVHVRRGDYAHTTTLRPSVRPLPLSYYRNAVERLSEGRSVSRLVIFSDDIAWCRDNFDLGIPCDFVVRDDVASSSVRDLIALSHCSRLIIANSTFSWWAAWIASQRGSVVASPLVWFSKAPQNKWTDWMIPSGWIRI